MTGILVGILFLIGLMICGYWATTDKNQMTTERFANLYRHNNMNLDQIRGLIRDLDDPDTRICRTEKRMRREALERIKREKSK